jgi:hypothetical protein
MHERQYLSLRRLPQHRRSGAGSAPTRVTGCRQRSQENDSHASISI